MLAFLDTYTSAHGQQIPNKAAVFLYLSSKKVSGGRALIVTNTFS